MADPLKPGQGVFAPGEFDYVYKRGEGPHAPEPEAAEPVPEPKPDDKLPDPYLTTRNRIPVSKVSDYGDAFDDGMAFALNWETVGDLDTGAPHEVKGDTGGFTKYGVAQNKNPEVDVRNLTLDGAVDLYRIKYWPEAAKIPKSAPDLQAVFLEGYINMGANSTRSLQRAVGADPDGSFGPRTRRALEKALDERGEDKITREFLWQRAEHYRRICRVDPSQECFEKGWLNRVHDSGDWYEDVLRSRK